MRPSFIMTYPIDIFLLWLTGTGGFRISEEDIKRLYMLGGPTSWQGNFYLIIYASVFHIEFLCAAMLTINSCDMIFLARTHTPSLKSLLPETFVLTHSSASLLPLWEYVQEEVEVFNSHPGLTLTRDLDCCWISFLLPHHFWTWASELKLTACCDPTMMSKHMITVQGRILHWSNFEMHISRHSAVCVHL